MKKCLILVDLQNDFMPGGRLAVPRGNEVIAIANSLQPHFDYVIATQDWHPKNHASFALNHPGRTEADVIELAGLTQILWPVHCVQGSVGAELVSDLNQDKINKIFQKGSDVEIDSYSGFFDNGHRKATGLGEYLKAHQIRDVYVMGLALDYCVKYTVLDALQLGFNTFLIEDGCRAVNLNAEDGESAVKAMERARASVVRSSCLESISF